MPGPIIPFVNTDLLQIWEAIEAINIDLPDGISTEEKQDTQILYLDSIAQKQYVQRPSEKTGRTYFSFRSGRVNTQHNNIILIPPGQKLYITSIDLTSENNGTVNFQYFQLTANSSEIWSDFIGAKVATGNPNRLNTHNIFPEPLQAVSGQLRLSQQAGGVNLLFYCFNLIGYLE